jgi:hypothetical protein
MEAHHREHSAPLDAVALVTSAVDAPDRRQGGFVMIDVPDLASRSFTGLERGRAREAVLNRNPILADYLTGARTPR